MSTTRGYRLEVWQHNPHQPSFLTQSKLFPSATSAYVVWCYYKRNYVNWAGCTPRIVVIPTGEVVPPEVYTQDPAELLRP